MKAMIPVSKKAKDVLEKLCTKDYQKFSNGGRAFMAVVAEKIDRTKYGPLWSIAHYFELNGDLCQDPEMVFLQGNDGEWYPVFFQQAIPPVFTEAVNFETEAVNLTRQRELAEFAGEWMANIKEQQGL